MENVEINEGLWRRGVSWRGILAGTFCTIAIGNLLLALGAGIGLVAAINQEGVGLDFGAAATGGGVWVALAIALATFIGAWVSVRISPFLGKAESVVQGLVTWAVSFQFGMLGLLLVSVVAAVAGQDVAAVTGEAATAASAASWWYFFTGAIAAVAGILGGLAGFGAREEVPRRPRRREVVEPTKAPA